MIVILSALSLLQAQPPARPAEAWVWSLYAEGDRLTLAREIPDTPRLSATLECGRGTGIAQATLYDSALTGGTLDVRAGEASAATPLTARGSSRSFALRTDHPVFAAFVAQGRMQAGTAAEAVEIVVPPRERAQLRQFAQACAG